MIYALEILDSKFIKIGFTKSKSIHKRVAALQTGCPYEIRVLFTVEGTLMQEKELHASLHSAFTRIRIPMPPNEWYPGRNNFMQEFLLNLRVGANYGMAFCDKYNQNVKQPGKKTTVLTANIKWPIK